METTNNKRKDVMFGKNLKSIETKNGNLIAGAVCLDVLEDEEVKALVYTYEGKRYLNVKVGQWKEEGKFGSTHFIAIDTFKPSSKEKEATTNPDGE